MFSDIAEIGPMSVYSSLHYVNEQRREDENSTLRLSLYPLFTLNCFFSNDGECTFFNDNFFLLWQMINEVLFS